MKTLNRDILYGLAGGVASILFSLAMYSRSAELFLGSMVFWVSTFILIFFIILAMLHARSGEQELADFKSLLKTGFTVYVVGNLLSYIFLFIMFNYVDPDLQEIQRQQAMDFVLKYRGGDETSAEFILAKEYDYGMTIGSTIFSYAQGLIFGFLVSALIAYMLKEKPYFDAN